MTRDELFEMIRTMLREEQENCITDPWIYDDEDLIHSVRSAIWMLVAIGVDLTFTMDTSGDFDTDPTIQEGVLLALTVCAELLAGDLANKLSNGELGVSFKSVLDTYSSTEGARGLEKAAKKFEDRLHTVLTIVLTNGIDAASAVFGQQGTSFADA